MQVRRRRSGRNRYDLQSLERKRELGDRQGVANSLEGLGLVARNQGDYDDAREYFERANERSREIGALREAVTTFENLVIACERMDDIEAAVEWCERARDWATHVDRIDLSKAASRFEQARRELASDAADDE